MAVSDNGTYKDATLSKNMLEYLTNGYSFDIPDVDFSDFNLPASLLDVINNTTPVNISLDELTTPELEGNAVFDRMMHAFKLHLKEELETGRITGAAYATVYTQLMGQAMQYAVEFELNRYKSQWEGILAQIQAITGNVQLATAKVQLAIAKAQAHTTRAQFAQIVAQLGIADVQKGMTEQQIESFKRKDDRDMASIFANVWTAVKGIDEGTVTPNALNLSQTNSLIQEVIKKASFTIKEN